MRELIVERIAASALAGAAAALVQIPLLCAGFIWESRSPLEPFTLIAAFLLGDDALLPSDRMFSVLVGLVTHLAAGSAFGVVFGLITLRQRRRRLGLLSAAYGLALGLALNFILLPAGVDLALAARMPAWLYLLAFLFFGPALLLFLPIERRWLRTQ